MRVTDRMLYDRAAKDGGAARTRLEAAVATASSGQKLVHPGDDPAGAGLVTMHLATQARAEAISSAAGQASDELMAVDSALNEVTNGLARAREIAMQFGSAGYSAEQRVAAATEASAIFKQVIAALNTKVGNRHLMGGTADGTPPFDSLTGAYLGDAGVRELEIAPGVLQAASIRADLAFQPAPPATGVNVMGTLGALVTALQANDQTAVAATLPDLATSTDQVSLARTQAGSAMAAFDVAIEVNRVARDEATTRAAHLTDADAIEANTQLVLAQRALEASLTATSSSFRLTLLNYLK